MGDWKIYKFSDFLTRVKIPITIEDNKEYKRVTIKTKHGGVFVRDIVYGTKIGTKKQFFLKEGQFVLSKIDARYGAFGIASSDVDGAIITGNFWAYNFDKNIISIEWLDHFTNSPSFYDACERASSGITHRKYLNEDEFLKNEILLPSIEQQHVILLGISSKRSIARCVKTELSHQQILLKKLRQQILQEAIEGKLTKQWRIENGKLKIEPASELLKRIKTEKEQLIKDKKIKKQKPLSPISEKEKPFDLPEGWVWCRLGEISDVKVGATPERQNPEYWDGSINWVSSGEVANNYVVATKETITEKAVSESSAKINPKGSVLVAMIGQGKTRGQTAILNIDAATNQNVAAIRLSKKIIPEIVWYFFLSRYEATRSGASGGNQPALNGIKIKSTIFALPPMLEAKKIIKRLREVEPLLNQLEIQITENQTHAQQLMQAVLKEAFSQSEKAEVS